MNTRAWEVYVYVSERQVCMLVVCNATCSKDRVVLLLVFFYLVVVYDIDTHFHGDVK